MPEENSSADRSASGGLCVEPQGESRPFTRTTYFTSALSPEPALKTIDGGHGRIETPTIRVTDDITWLEERHSWPGLKSIIAVTAKRESDNKVSEETRYFLSSLCADTPRKLEHAVRAHWAIENNLHWVLDAFDEDSNRASKGHSVANLAVIRHIETVN